MTDTRRKLRTSITEAIGTDDAATCHHVADALDAVLALDHDNHPHENALREDLRTSRKMLRLRR